MSTETYELDGATLKHPEPPDEESTPDPARPGEVHRVGEHGVDRRCEIQPYESIGDDGKARYGHWQDERGYWHYGRRLTDAEKQKLWA